MDNIRNNVRVKLGYSTTAVRGHNPGDLPVICYYKCKFVVTINNLVLCRTDSRPGCESRYDHVEMIDDSLCFS
jgi:hypothetical protein